MTPLLIPPRFHGVDEVRAGLSRLEQEFLSRQDRRAVFASAYGIATRTVAAWIAEGRFLENGLMTECLVAFANRYRQALEDYEHQRPGVPAAWRLSFDAAEAPETSVLQNLLLGINAHINHDLPYAVADAGFDLDCARCHHDHMQVNDALRQATPIVRVRTRRLFRTPEVLGHRLFGWTVDRLADQCFRQARENAWHLARSLRSTASVHDRDRLGQAIDHRAVARGRAILAHRHAPARGLACLAAIDAHPW